MFGDRVCGVVVDDTHDLNVNRMTHTRAEGRVDAAPTGLASSTTSKVSDRSCLADERGCPRSAEHKARLGVPATWIVRRQVLEERPAAADELAGPQVVSGPGALQRLGAPNVRSSGVGYRVAPASEQ